MWQIILAALLTTLAGCVSVPDDIDGPIDRNITLSAVRANGDMAQGQLVRWGGLIARVQNKENQSWVEIVEMPISRGGRPVGGNNTGGRFIAIFDRFLDPMIFSQGREITVSGALQPAIDGRVDEQPYKYAVVVASGYHLWEPRVERDYDQVILIGHSYWDPWWYTPIYPMYYQYPRRYHAVPRTLPPTQNGNNNSGGSGATPGTHVVIPSTPPTSSHQRGDNFPPQKPQTQTPVVVPRPAPTPTPRATRDDGDERPQTRKSDDRKR